MIAVDTPSQGERAGLPMPMPYPPSWAGTRHVFVDTPCRLGTYGFVGDGYIAGDTAPHTVVRCAGHISGTPVTSVMSDANGHYHIGNLRAGRRYDLRFGHVADRNDRVHTGVVAGT
jgi:hypothetical protein